MDNRDCEFHERGVVSNRERFVRDSQFSDAIFYNFIGKFNNEWYDTMMREIFVYLFHPI